MGEGIHTAILSGPKSLQYRILEGLLGLHCFWWKQMDLTLNSQEADDGTLIRLSPGSTDK